MIDFNSWLLNVNGHYFVPLFEAKNDLIVTTKFLGKDSRRILVRNSLMEKAVIDIIEGNIDRRDWEGLLYIMGRGDQANFVPLYIGKTEKKGVKHPISVNIVNIRTNKGKFARWGDNLAYHIGDLSHALFEFEAYKKPAKKYKKWAKKLFSKYEPPTLKETINFYLLPWYEGDRGISGLQCSLPALEKELISLASVYYKDDLLNVDGV